MTGGTRWALTDADRAALEIDDAIQTRLDTEALDAIAALLRAGAQGPWLLDRIAEHVATTRRHTRRLHRVE